MKRKVRRRRERSNENFREMNLHYLLLLIKIFP